MKFFITLIVLSLSLSAFAQSKITKDCEEQVLKQFITATQDYDFHSLSNTTKLHTAGTLGFESFGRFVELGYDFDVISITGSNEYMSGYGAYELIVDPKTCVLLKMQEVYAE